MRDPGPAPSDDVATSPLHHRTAWHPLLVMLLEMLLPRDRWRVLAEFPLTREPRRIDAVVVRQVAVGTWRPHHLRSVLDDLRAHNVVHFKGATDDLEASDALQLLSYAYQYMALEGIKHPDALALRVVAPRLTPRFREQLVLLGGEIRETAVTGVHEGAVQTLRLRVVETSVAWPAPGEHLLYPISPAYLKQPVCPEPFDDTEWALYYRLAQGITRLAQDPNWRAIMKDASQLSDATRQALMDLLAVIPPEQRLAGLAPEQRLAGLAPEQRTAGLSESDRVLALPDGALRALPAEYLATLPADAQQRIRARLGR